MTTNPHATERTPAGAGSGVRLLTESEFPVWNALVAESAQGTLFHTTDWLSASGSPFEIYGCFKGCELRGGFALGKLAEGHGAHPKLVPYLGLVFPPRHGKYVSALSAEKETARFLAQELKQRFQRLTCRFSPEVLDLQPFLQEGYQSNVYYTYRLELSDLNKVWDEMDATRRNDIRRAEKDGVTVESGAKFDETMILIEKTYARQKSEVHFKEAAYRFETLLARTGQHRSFLARNPQGVAISAAYIVWDNKRAYYLLGGYDTDSRHHGAGALALWQAIRFTKETLGLAQFDFEGSMVPAIEQFFRKFGGQLTPRYGVSWTKPAPVAAPPGRRSLTQRIRRLFQRR